MSIVFYYTPMSSATRIHWALEELGVPYDKKKMDLTAGDQKKPDYLALNPNGKVPLVVDDGVPIFESLAILLHLGERFGVEKGLFPAAGMARAEAFKWIAWSQVSLGDVISRLFRNATERFPAEERSAKAAETAKREAGEHLAILDKALAGKEYLGGKEFSFTDLACAGACMVLGRFGIDFGPYPAVHAWVGRCTSRPALARAMQG
jgi:glutathione S-transferase